MATPALTLTLFGTFRAAVDDIPVAGFATDKVRALLAYLAVEADRPHLRAHLATLLWPDMADDVALRNLRKTLHRLQQAMAPLLGAEDQVIVATRQAVQLNPATCAVDIGAFQSLVDVTAAHPHRALHLCPLCLGRLGQAAALYRGELLTGFGLPDAEPFEEWLLLKREMLLHQALQILYALAAGHLERGEFDQAHRYAVRQVELDPVREEAHRQVLRALGGSGQRSEALAYFERCRQLLHESLGVEPAQETVALVEQLGTRSGDEGSAGDARTGPMPIRGLPTPLTPFIGRATELLQIADYLQDADCRVVSILGPGGVGKTRLAIRAAEEAARNIHFNDGIIFLSLAEVDAVELLPPVLAAGLGLDLDQSRDARAQLLAYLANKDCLLVLDNLEQFRGGMDLLVASLTAGPKVRLLVTSRLPLGLHAEQRVDLEGLDFLRPDADLSAELASTEVAALSSVQLFVQAARRVQPAFALSPSNERDILRVCQLVDGIPLALELAAPWIRVMDCAAMASVLERDLALLTTTAQDVPVRHRSMEAVFAQSWRLLSSGEQTVLARLSVFRGPFDLEAAATVAGASLVDLAAFADAGLLRIISAGLYQLHPMLRHFTAQMLAEMPGAELETVHDRHSRYYLGLVTGQEVAVGGPEAGTAERMLQQQIANFQQALEWAADHDRYDALVASPEGMGRLWELVALFGDANGKLGAAMDRLRLRLEARRRLTPSASAVLVRLLVWRAHVEETRHRFETAIRAAQAAHTLAESIGDAEGRAAAQRLLGETLPHRGDFREASRLLRQACAYYQNHDRRQEAARVLRLLGIVHWRSGEYREALEHLYRARDLQQLAGDHWELAHVYNALAGIAFEQGDLDRAEMEAHDALRWYEAIGDRRKSAAMRGNLALIYRRQERFDLALRYNQDDLAFSRELGDQHDVATALGNRGAIYLDSGDLEQAVQCFEQALQMEEEAGNAWDAARHRAEIAHVFQLRGEQKLALAHYERALPALRSRGAHYYAVPPLLDAAELHLGLGNLEDAAILLEEADTLARELGVEEMVQRGQDLAGKIAVRK